MFAEEVGNYLPLPIELIRPIRFLVAYNLIKDKLKFPVNQVLRISNYAYATWNFYRDGRYEIKWSFNRSGDHRAYSVVVSDDSITPKIYTFACQEFYDRQYKYK